MPTETLPVTTPVEILMQIAGGYSLSRCLHVVADLGVADALGDSPRTAASLAESTGADADALNRVLRLLSCHGIFESRDREICPHTRLPTIAQPSSSLDALVREHDRLAHELRCLREA